MSKHKKHKPISDQLREAILNAPVSRYRIAKDTGVTEASLSRFVNGITGMELDLIDKIGEYLGLDIVAREREPEKRKGR